MEIYEIENNSQLEEWRLLRRVEIGANIRRARHRVGWTQQQVADVLGYSRSHIHRVELGLTELGVPDLEILAERLRIPLRSIVERELDSWDR